MKEALFRGAMYAYRMVFARKVWYPLNRFLLNLSLRGLGVAMDGGADLHRSGEWHFLRYLSRNWGPVPVILDVGAHHGRYAQAVKTLAPGARIYAFEPHPNNLRVLQRTADEHHFEAIPLGCGDRHQRREIFDLPEDDGSLVATLYKPAIEELWREPPVAHSVEIVCLDEFVRSRQLPHIDLLKIDTEGHELQVLKGALHTINDKRVDVIQFEFNAMNVFSRCFMKDFMDLLPQYSFHRMLPRACIAVPRYSPVLCEIFGLQNLVAVRNDCGIHV